MPICPECDSREMEFYRSKWTRRPVYRDAKVMAKCRQCGNVFIVVDEYLETHVGIPKRKRWWRLATYTAATAFGVTEFWYDIFEYALSTRTALILAIVFGTLAVVEVGMWRTLALGRQFSLQDYSKNAQSAIILAGMLLLILFAYAISRQIVPA